MLYIKKPKDFSPKFHVVSCFVECEGNILLLNRADNKPQGNTWGVPAGKVESGESIVGALIREVQEETGITLDEKTLAYFQEVYVRYKDFDFVYHIFHCYLSVEMSKSIKINPKDHKAFLWDKPQTALGMNLIEDEDACINLYYFNGRAC